MPTVYGIVYDRNTRHGVSGAFIDFDGYTTRTNFRGEYAVILPAGTYVVRVTHRDYSSYSAHVRVVRDMRVDIPLTPRVTML